MRASSAKVFQFFDAMPRLLPLILILFFVGDVVASQPAALERIHWEKHISKPTTLIFKNHHGHIRLRSSADEKLVFHAVAQSSKQHEVRIDFKESDGLIEAEVLFKNAEDLPDDHRVDAVIVVPSVLSLDLDIARGQLTSKGLKSVIKARSIDSDIKIKTTEAVDLFSQNGDIHLTAKNNPNPTQHLLKSHKGDVNVYVHQDSENTFKTTSGTATSSNDASLIESMRKAGRSVFFGSEKAHRQFDIQTDTGFIRLIKQKHQ